MMTARETPEQIEEAALAWAVRFPLSEEEEEQFEAWMAGDRRRRGAVTRALAGWSMLDRAQAGGPMASAEVAPDNDDEPAVDGRALSWIRRRHVLGMLGSGIAAAVTGLVVLPRLGLHRETTSLGEIRRLPLQDGSLATINTDSAIDIRLGRKVRSVALVRGEAWFEVAKDPSRPFVVESGHVSVRAVGTAFSVRRSDDTTTVSVTEGVVAVSQHDSMHKGFPLTAGEQVTIGHDGLIGDVRKSPENIQRALAWRTGEIALEGETLGYAVDEYNRYNSRKLVIASDALAQERLVGMFDVNNPEGFAETVSEMLDLRVAHRNDEILLFRDKISPVATELPQPSI
ncbi:FecR domain-containing protein [Novosphingobium flavum]|uniref:FecR domain-containing protein n=1 Tax=Novosphingobium flavum TaxID=1778672 RepID=A0A7X1KMH6_9SPHN|nr:FecR domain-containing protein [Novosphingobium flavum]MBC2666656.1 FecR domain-containing protein [Novosphingobium flavum]